MSKAAANREGKIDFALTILASLTDEPISVAKLTRRLSPPYTIYKMCQDMQRAGYIGRHQDGLIKGFLEPSRADLHNVLGYKWPVRNTSRRPPAAAEVPKRICRSGCGRNLPPARYFQCFHCQPELPSEWP